MPSINLPKPGGNQSLQLINQTIPSRNSQFQNGSTASASIWLNTGQTPNAALFSINASSQNNTTKPPLSLRTRPLSAGNGKSTMDSLNQPKLNGWIKGNSNQSSISGRLGFVSSHEQENNRQVGNSWINVFFCTQAKLFKKKLIFHSNRMMASYTIAFFNWKKKSRSKTMKSKSLTTRFLTFTNPNLSIYAQLSLIKVLSNTTGHFSTRNSNHVVDNSNYGILSEVRIGTSEAR